MITGWLSGGELKKRYSTDFLVVETPSARSYPEGHELRKLISVPSGRAYIPYLVFLDANGNKVVENRGFNTEFEARAMHAYVSGRAYQRVSFQEFLGSYKD